MRVNKIKRLISGFLTFLFLTLSLTYHALALPGHLDTSFDGDGKVITVFIDANEAANASAIQSNGRIVVAGRSGGDFALARYNTNGSLDTSFSGNGLESTDFGGTDEANAIAIQSDGKIVAAGRSGSNFALARYNANGTLDTTFSGDGKLTTDFFGGTDSARGVAIQSDGKIVAAGPASQGQSVGFAIARYNTDGTLDTTFGSGLGRVFTDISSCVDIAQAMAIQTDGKIVVVGVSGCANEGDFAAVRYNTNGTLDTSFSNDGIVLTDFIDTSDDEAFSVAIQPDGKIVVGGFAEVNTFDSAVARYNSNGSLDTTFSGDGKVTTRISSTVAEVAIQADGKIVTAGAPGFSLVRYNSDGTLDTTFSGDGEVNTTFGGSNLGASAIAIQKANGRIVVAGFTNAQGTNDFALARYHAFECNGSNVTILGTSGADNISGLFAPGPSGPTDNVPDVIHGLGSGDTINGLGGDDIICGGGGSDTINGGKGNDSLFGQSSADTLDGGDDTDTCVGGGQAGDTFSQCETINTGSSGFSGTWIDIFQNCNRSGQNPMCKIKGIVEVENPGTESTAVPTQVAFYLSDDEILDENDRFLEYVNVPALEPGERTDVRLNIKLKGEVDLFGLFGIVVLDFFNSVPEINENNVFVSPPIR